MSINVTRPDTQVPAITSPIASNFQDSYLVSGGQVIYQSALTFTVSAAVYYIRGTRYTSLQQDVTLTAADETNPRIDVIALDTTGTVVKVDGTAAVNPSEPDIEPSTQLKLAFVLVAAGATSITVTTLSLYLENAGSAGGEWDTASSGTTWALASTNNPRTDTKCIEATSLGANAYVELTIGSGNIDINAYDYLVLYIRSKATWASGRGLRAQWRNASIALGTPLTIAQTYWGFDSSITTSYQQIAIPTSQFVVSPTTPETKLRFTRIGGAIGFYIDDVKLVKGGFTQTAPGLTKEQADILYVPHPVPSPATDHSTSGPVSALIAAEALVFGNFCYINSSSKLAKTDADAAATSFIAAMALETIAQDAAGKFLVFGWFVRDDSWNWTPGAILYLDVTAAAITATAPSGVDDVVLAVGVAYTADIALLRPSSTIVEHV